MSEPVDFTPEDDAYIYAEFRKGTHDKYIAAHLCMAVNAIRQRREKFGWLHKVNTGPFTPEEDAILTARFHDFVNDRSVAKELNRTIDSIKMQRRKLNLIRHHGPQLSNYDPTEDEIAKACAEIQKSWSEQDKESRARWMADPHKFPAYRMMGRANGQYVFSVEEE